MSSVRPYVENLRADIRAYVPAGPVFVLDVASRALSSPAVVQSVFKDAGTTFSDELRRARVEIAFEALVADGISTATRVSSLVNVTPGHLTRLLKAEYGLTTRQILRVCVLRDTITTWHNQLPPRPRSYLYHRRRERWDAAYDELLTLLKPIHARHPHRAWADKLAQSMVRPDYREREHRATLRSRRIAMQRRRSAETERRNRQLRLWAAKARTNRAKKAPAATTTAERG